MKKKVPDKKKVSGTFNYPLWSSIVKDRENEVNAFYAFIEIIKSYKGFEYVISSRPDTINRSTPDIDCVLSPKFENSELSEIAIEHTIIERYHNMLSHGTQSYDKVEEINRRCKGLLPQDRFFSLSYQPDLDLSTKKLRECFYEAMLKWIPDVAKTLNDTQEHDSMYYKGHKIILLRCGSSLEHNGTVGRIQGSPGSAHKEGLDIFTSSIDRKLEKLLKYKKNGFITVLLLEFLGYFHIDYEINLYDLLSKKIPEERLSCLDYLVIFTSHANEMLVGYILKDEKQFYPRISDDRRFDSFKNNRSE